MRNALAHVGAKQRQMVATAIRTAFTQETQKAASTEWRAVANRLRGRFPKLAELMDEAEDDVLALLGEWLIMLVADTLRIKSAPPSPPERGDELPPDLDDILARLRSEDWSDREDAIFDLGDLANNPPPAAVDALSAALEDESLRGDAPKVLEPYTDRRVLDALLGALEREKTHDRWQYRGTFGSICTAIGVRGDEDPRAVDALAEHLVIDG
jgi:HEAT repeat protein